jgi:hypothetical protein
MLLFVGLVVQGQVWMVVPPEIVIWGCALLVQVSLLVWAQFLFEQYSIVRYIETELRKKVEPLVGSVQIWQYELFLARSRGKASAWWEYATPLGVLAVFVVAVTLRWQYKSIWDYWGAGANLALIFLQAFRAANVVRARRKWEKADSKLLALS